MAFVVGVIRGTDNSAYWVDAGGPVAICHKMGDDLKRLYRPRRTCADEKNPFPCGNAQVGALICMDAWDAEPSIQERRNCLLEKLRRWLGRKILCVPAWPTVYNLDHRQIQALVPDCWVVLASGGYLSGSFIAPPSETRVADCVSVDNQIQFLPLPELDGGPAVSDSTVGGSANNRPAQPA